MSLQGEQLGKYRLERVLGSGGMGEVYLASDMIIRRQVAIKVIRAVTLDYPGTESSKEASRLFLREVKAVAALDHPHILPLYDYGEAEMHGATVTYMVMPLRQEGTLTTWLHDKWEHGLLSPLDAAQIILQAASGLQYAHDHHIIHQDVKPSNFLIRYDEQNPGLPYLLLSDFGVARLTSMTTGMSQSIRGTPAYMAPEQWEGNSVPATDQYALAIMAYELLTGRPPFTGGMTQMMYQHINVPPPPARTLNHYLSPDIDLILQIALAKKPEGRFNSVMAFANAFQQAAQSLNATAISSIQQMPVPKDFLATLSISKSEAEHGSARVVTLSNGRRISVSIPPGTHDGQILRLDNQGRLVPDSDEGGTIILSIAVAPDREQQSNAPTFITTANQFSPNTPSNPGKAPGQANFTVAPTLPSSLPPTTAIPPTPPARRTGITMPLAIVLVVLVLLIIAGGVLYFMRPQSPSQATNTHSNSTTSSPTVSSSTPTAVITATSLSSTPTTAITATPLSSTNPYTNSGTQVLDDPLTNNSQGHAWMEGTNSAGATCQFSSNAYQSLEPNNNFFHSCMEQAINFTNFVFEVRETLISGDYEGIVFRVNPANRNQYYFFGVYSSGQYILRLSPDANPNDTVDLSKGTSSAILTAPNQTNIIAVVANFGNIALYVNKQLVASISDPTLSTGLLGMLAGNDTTNAIADFQDAKVWKL